MRDEITITVLSFINFFFATLLSMRVSEYKPQSKRSDTMTFLERKSFYCETFTEESSSYCS